MAKCVVLVLSITAALVQADSEISKLFIESNGQLSAKLFGTIREQNGNFLTSPLGLNYGLTVASLGADGDTLKQLKGALKHPEDDNKVIASYKQFTDSIKTSNSSLSLAVGIFIDDKFKVNKDFVKKAEDNFDTAVKNVNFLSQPEEARGIINKFVDSKTNHVVPELIAKGQIEAGTVAAIVNAFHLKASWKYPFDKFGTKKKQFYGQNKESLVYMMERYGTYNYADDIETNSEILEVPLQDGFSFLVMLPHDKKGITDLENNIISLITKNPEWASDGHFLKNFKPTQLTLDLPRFNYTDTLRLRKTLEKMGVTDIFVPASAKLDKINDSENQLAVNDFIQKTSIMVDESGVELTNVKYEGVLPDNEIHLSRKTFIVDRPFIFVIIQDTLRIPLLVGRIMDLN